MKNRNPVDLLGEHDFVYEIQVRASWDVPYKDLPTDGHQGFAMQISARSHKRQGPNSQAHGSKNLRR